MMDLGKKQKELYESPATAGEGKNKIVYPEIDMPMGIIEGISCKVGDDVEIKIKGKLVGMQDTRWTKRVTFECREGEVKKTGKKSESVMREA
jgi:hypothetical protein